MNCHFERKMSYFDCKKTDWIKKNTGVIPKYVSFFDNIMAKCKIGYHG